MCAFSHYFLLRFFAFDLLLLGWFGASSCASFLLPASNNFQTAATSLRRLLLLLGIFGIRKRSPRIFCIHRPQHHTHSADTTHFRLDFHAHPHSHPDVRWSNRSATPRTRSGTVFRTEIVPFLRNNTRDKHSRFDHGSAKVGHFEKFSSLALCCCCPAATSSLFASSHAHIGRIVHKLLLLLFCCYKHRSFSSVSGRPTDESVFVCLLTNTNANGFDGAAA